MTPARRVSQRVVFHRSVLGGGGSSHRYKVRVRGGMVWWSYVGQCAYDCVSMHAAVA